MRHATLSVRGTRYYGCAEALRSGALVVDAPITLQHEPSNPHDANAIAVYLTAQQIQLGHVGRELAPKYLRMLKAGAIKSARVSSIDTTVEKGRGARAVVHIVVAYSFAADESPRSPTRPASPPITVQRGRSGVYWIACLKAGRIYVGESADVDQRWKQHFHDLEKGCHENSHMQSDFKRFGRAAFKSTLTVAEPDKLLRLAAEEAEIAKLLSKGQRLYNMTSDGKGRLEPGSGRDDAPPISDWTPRAPPSPSGTTPRPTPVAVEAEPENQGNGIHLGWIFAGIALLLWAIAASR